MVKTTIAILYTLALCSFASAQELTVETWGIQIARQSYGKTKYGAELAPFNAQNPGTKIILALKSPNGGIIEIDDKNSKLTDLVDDQKKKLHEVKSKFGENVRFFFPKVSEDGKVAMLPITCDGVPSAKATRLKLKGEVSLFTGSNKAEKKSTATALTKGATITVGEYKFKIDSAGKPRFGNKGHEIVIKTNKSLDDIASINILKPDGSPVETKITGRSRSSFGGKTSVSRSLKLVEPLEEGILVLEVWLDRKKVTIPIDQVVSIGGGI